DLDFTLINNEEGIVNSFNFALKKYNLTSLEKKEILAMIGIPLDQMFLVLTKVHITELMAAFREYYGSKGMYQVKIFPGVRDKLIELKKFFKLGVITSKKQDLAIKLLEHLNLASYFSYILGESDNWKTKTDPNLIAYIRRKFPDYQFVIIGDHPKDKELAIALDTPFIGVLTGKYSEKQLKSNSKITTLIVNSVNDITKEKILSLF
ncbi:MAG: HAD family hydrolase, partial [Candidatus Hermodarchaeota archaeon]